MAKKKIRKLDSGTRGKLKSKRNGMKIHLPTRSMKRGGIYRGERERLIKSSGRETSSRTQGKKAKEGQPGRGEKTIKKKTCLVRPKPKVHSHGREEKTIEMVYNLNQKTLIGGGGGGKGFEKKA